VRRALVFASVVVGVLGLSQVPASAHAQLESSSPSASAILEQGPAEITLDFNEAVTPVPRSIEIYDQAGNRLILEEAVVSADDDTVMSAGGVPELPDGVYAVVWRVLSDDGHVAEGAYTFQVGTSESTIDPADLLTGVLDGSAGPSGLSWAMGVARWLTFVGVALALGGLALLAGGGITSVRSVRLVLGGWVSTVVGSAALFVLQGPYTTAGQWSDVFDTGVWADVLDTRLGTALIWRIGLLVVLAGLLATLRGSFDRSLSTWWRSSTALIGAAIVVTFAASGHPSASRSSGLAVAMDALHLSSVILWFGGLVIITVGSVLSSPNAPAVVGRFSRLSTWAIPIAVVTGVWQTWHLVPRMSDITDTDWGKGLLIKVCFVVGAVTLGAFGRWVVRHLDHTALRRVVAVEAAMGLMIFAVTAGMVAKSPEVSSTSTVFQSSLVEGDMIADVSVTPGRVGYNEIHLTLATPSGSLQPVDTVEMRMTLPNSEIPSVSVSVEQLGPNHYVGSLSVLYAGTWTLEILVNPDPSTSKRFTADVPISS
jgi:copper transport protein